MSRDLELLIALLMENGLDKNVAYKITDYINDIDDVPIWEKYALTISEAAKYFHIGTTTITKLTKQDKEAPYLLWNGKKVLIKRKAFEDFLDQSNQI